jgi:hypothetical protein
MKVREHDTIPAFLSIDVEPDAFQISRDNTQKWSGYGGVFDLSLWLRKELSRKSGMTPNFGWYYRMDPQIEDVCGRADAAMTGFPGRTAALREQGDYFGVHAHPLRWSAKQRLWVHDFGDRNWLRECTRFSLDAFERCNGSQPQVYRAGASFLNDDIVDVLDDHGVALELSLEPVEGWGLHSTVVPCAVDTSPIVGNYTNCIAAPQTPYRPAREEFRRIGSNGDARSILLIPLSTGSRTLPSWRSKLKRRLRGAPEPDPVGMLYPTVDWPSERYFWDIVAHQLQSMQRPYLSLAIRTDPPASAPTAKLSRLFAALVKHPLAERLRFVNPLDVKEQITPPQYS